MVLVGLYLVEVAALAYRESVVTVELEESRYYGIVASHALYTGYGVTRLEHGTVPPIGVVERLLALPGIDYRIVARYEAVALYYPYKLLARVVEV